MRDLKWEYTVLKIEWFKPSFAADMNKVLRAQVSSSFRAGRQQGIRESRWHRRIKDYLTLLYRRV